MCGEEAKNLHNSDGLKTVKTCSPMIISKKSPLISFFVNNLSVILKPKFLCESNLSESKLGQESR